MKQTKILRVVAKKGDVVRVAVPAVKAPKSLVGAFKCCCSNEANN
ncbi:hypothetical protein [Chitinimonas koreensis]|nr:hypothetical protein [Chitinimonas koreensis]